MRVALILLLLGTLAPPAVADQCTTCTGRGVSACTPCRGTGRVRKDLRYMKRELVIANLDQPCESCRGQGKIPDVGCAGRGRLLPASQIGCPHCKAFGVTVCGQCGGPGYRAEWKGRPRKLKGEACRRCGKDGWLKCQDCRGRRTLDIGVRLRAPDAFVCPACPGFPDVRKGRAGLKCILCLGNHTLALSGIWGRFAGLESLHARTADKRERVESLWSQLKDNRERTYPPQWRAPVARLAMLWALRVYEVPSENRDRWKSSIRRWYDAQAQGTSTRPDTPGNAPDTQPRIPEGNPTPQSSEPLDLDAEAGRQFPAATKEFVAIDGDKSGGVTSAELEAHYSTLKKKLRIPNKLYRYYDVDRNGKWTRLEYVTWWARYRPESALVK